MVKSFEDFLDSQVSYSICQVVDAFHVHVDKYGLDEVDAEKQGNLYYEWLHNNYIQHNGRYYHSIQYMAAQKQYSDYMELSLNNYIKGV